MSDDQQGGEPIGFSLDGERLEGREGDTVAAALLRAGVTTFTRSIKYHRPRGPFCFGATCGQCLVRIDGVPSLPSCQVRLRDGMACERQNAPLGLIDSDLFRAVDFIYPGGLDHHHLMIQSRLLGRVALEVARRLAGLGTLPDEARLAQPGSVRTVPLAIIGAGPAGLAAARGALAAGVSGLKPLVLERSDAPGGAARLWRDGAESAASDPWSSKEFEPARVELQLNAEVVGLYADGGPAGEALLAVRQGPRLLAVRAHRVVIATGGASQPLPFAGNDRPGVYAARGLLELHRRSGVRVGGDGPLALVGAGEELVRCARSLVARGYRLAAMVVIDNHFPAPASLPPGVELIRGEPVRARGRPVSELQIALAPPDGPGLLREKLAVRKLRCGAVAIALPPAPLYDLAASAGARAEFSAEAGGFPLVVDASGRTSLPWIFACGTAAGEPLSGGKSPSPEKVGAPSNSAAQSAMRAGGQAAREAAALESAEGESRPDPALA